MYFTNITTAPNFYGDWFLASFDYGHINQFSLPRFHRIIIIDSETKTGQNWKGMFILIFWQSKRILWLISFESCTVKFILREVLKRNNFWKRRAIPNYCTFHLFFWFLYVQTFHNINISLKNASKRLQYSNLKLRLFDTYTNEKTWNKKVHNHGNNVNIKRIVKIEFETFKWWHVYTA